MQQSNRKVLAALFFMFMIPMLFAWVMYHRGLPIGKTTNHGILITPPVQAEQLFKSLPHKWTMVWFTPNHCHDKQCLHLLHQLNQVKKAMGKYQSNVHIAVLTLPSNQNDVLLKKILNANTKINEVVIKPSNYQTLLHEKSDAGMIYLVDPRRFIMMKYSEDTDPMNIFHDLHKLLKHTG